MLIILLAAFAAQAPPEARWLSPDAVLAQAMTTAPAECFGRIDPRDAYAVEAGRAVFRNPYLFGGDAGEGGLSCQTCHASGAVNADLFVDGLSDAPGSVDTASRLFGRAADDGEYAPRAIPTIAGARAGAMHAMDDALGDGMANALRAYVAALKPGGCADAPTRASPSRDLADAARALRVSIEARRRADKAIADAAQRSARAGVGAVLDRFAAAGFEEERRRLDSLLRALDALRTGYRLEAESATRSLADAIEDEGRALDARIPGSYYDPQSFAPASPDDAFTDQADEF